MLLAPAIARSELDRASLILELEPDSAARMVTGDELALDRLLRPLLTPAYRLAYMMLRDREAAEDAVQEAALKSWRKLKDLRPGTDLRPWFFGFVANECRNARRSRWRAVIRLGARDDIAAAGPTWVSDPDVERALLRLSDRDRLIVLLHFYLGMSLEEIATVTRGRTAGIRSRLYRAVKQLRPGLEVED